MSVVFALVPLIPVALAYPTILSVAAAVASTVGFHLAEHSAESINKLYSDAGSCAEIEMKATVEISDLIENNQGGFTMEKEDYRIIFVKAADGKVKMMVTSDKKIPTEQLIKYGEDMMHQIMQRYAYDQLMKSLNKEGFKVINELVQEDNTIKLTVRRWE
ncbi:MAG: DUF1257 domain-containing protein [Chloroflexi bacterium]|nr:DUF1257 domain-containing protein [Chloroflexota bacterium]